MYKINYFLVPDENLALSRYLGECIARADLCSFFHPDILGGTPSRNR
jgi:hypothetical protein